MHVNFFLTHKFYLIMSKHCYGNFKKKKGKKINAGIGLLQLIHMKKI